MGANEDAELDYENWATGFGNFYAAGSRIEREYRFTRQTVFAARKWTAYIDRTIRKATGHTRAHWQTLFALAFVPDPTPVLELSKRVGVRWPTLVRTLNALEEEGLVVREQSREDRRSTLVGITDAGREVVDRVQDVLDPTRSTLLDSLSDSELVETERVLKKFHALVIARN